MIRAGIFSDTHCGHRAGLTPPEYQSGGRKWVYRQSEKWDWFINILKDIGKLDAAIWLGDLPDGQGVRNASETIIPNLNRQINCCVDVIETVNCKENFFLYGTCVHVTSKEGIDLEYEIAKQVTGKQDPNISDEMKIQFGNHILNCRHQPAGKSHVPHTRANPIQRERMADEQWYLDNQEVEVLSDIYLRGHLHYMATAGIPNRWQGFNVPALQSPHTKYGARTLSNVVHCGFCVLESDGSWPILKVYEAPRERRTVLKF